MLPKSLLPPGDLKGLAVDILARKGLVRLFSHESRILARGEMVPAMQSEAMADGICSLAYDDKEAGTVFQFSHSVSEAVVRGGSRLRP